MFIRAFYDDPNKLIALLVQKLLRYQKVTKTSYKFNNL